jgi:hypothetical protein
VTNELQLLIEALQKKEKILQEILDKSRLQLQVAGEETLDTEKFDALVDDKDVLLAEMEKLDEGFDATYQRIRDELLAQKDKYKTEISALQKLIGDTIDLGAQIHTTETRTKDKLSGAILKSKRELSQKKTSARAVSDYYKISNNLKYVDSYFLDQKK